MRYPGENAAGHAPGRRRSPSGQDMPPRTAQGTGRSQPGGESSVFVPGYRDDRQAAAEPDHDAARHGSQYGWAASASGKGPVRGFPPAPGQPPPLYPPGQFSAWNRGSVAQADRPAGEPWTDEPWADEPWAVEPWQPEYGEPEYGEPGHGEPGHGEAAHAEPGAGPAEAGYPALAVSDPAADVTSTQTWGTVGGDPATGAWTDLRTPGGEQQPSVASTRAGAASGPGTTQPGRARGHGTGAHSARTGPRGRMGSQPRARRKLSRGLLAAGIAVLIVLAGATYVLLGGSPASRGGQAAGTASNSARSRPSPSPSASSPAPTPTPPGPWGHIESRTADPVPLTVAEVFPATFAAGTSYSRTVSRTGTNCAKAVVGGKLQHAVQRPGCSQVLRASYLSVSKKLMGTIGVLNLKSFKAAERAGKAAGPAEFIEQLAAAKGPTRNLSKGTGIEEALVKGHYVILVWAEFTTLHKPKTKNQRSELEAFMSLLIQKTANVSLTSRMVTGKP